MHKISWLTAAAKPITIYIHPYYRTIRKSTHFTRKRWIQELERLNAELLHQHEILANIQANDNGFLQLQNEAFTDNSNIVEANLRINNQSRRNNFNFNPCLQLQNNAQISSNRNRITAIVNVPDFSGQP